MKSGNLESEVPPSGKGDGSTGWGTAETETRRRGGGEEIKKGL